MWSHYTNTLYYYHNDDFQSISGFISIGTHNIYFTANEETLLTNNNFTIPNSPIIGPIYTFGQSFKKILTSIPNFLYLKNLNRPPRYSGVCKPNSCTLCRRQPWQPTRRQQTNRRRILRPYLRESSVRDAGSLARTGELRLMKGLLHDDPRN